jgi:hypothetical protein
MNNINAENYEHVFFKLIENEYTLEEKENVLAEIMADPFYSFEWESWKKAQLVDESSEFAVAHKSFFDGIKADASIIPISTHKTTKRFSFFQMVGGIAACVSVAFTLYFYNFESEVNTGVTTKSTDAIENKSVIKNGTDSIASKFSNKTKKHQHNTITTRKYKQQSEVDSGSNSMLHTPIVTYKWDEIYLTRKNIDTFFNVQHTPPNVPYLSNFSPPAFRRNFIVSKSDTITKEIVVSLSEFEDNNTNLIKLFDNKRITLIRVDKKLYIKLVEENERTLLVKLN